jgi:sugar/nucleoside kinase (ribokinase family)
VATVAAGYGPRRQSPSYWLAGATGTLAGAFARLSNDAKLISVLGENAFVIEAANWLCDSFRVE